MASEASHITYEVFGEIRAGGSSHARPRAYLLVLLEFRNANLPGLSPTEGHPLDKSDLITWCVMDEIPRSSSFSSESRASSKLQRTEAVREEESLPQTTPDDSTELTTELDKNIDRATIAIRRVEEMINFEREPPRNVPEWNMRTRVTILQINSQP